MICIFLVRIYKKNCFVENDSRKKKMTELCHHLYFIIFRSTYFRSFILLSLSFDLLVKSVFFFFHAILLPHVKKLLNFELSHALEINLWSNQCRKKRRREFDFVLNVEVTYIWYVPLSMRTNEWPFYMNFV